MQIELDFTGYVAICTGGASGMGLMTAQKMAASGAKVVLCDVNGEAAEAKAAEIRAAGGEALGLCVDVRHYDEIQAAVDRTLEAFGRIDYLINAAGGASTASATAPAPSGSATPKSSSGASTSTSRATPP